MNKAPSRAIFEIEARSATPIEETNSLTQPCHIRTIAGKSRGQSQRQLLFCRKIILYDKLS
jgi:hypothetical protein